LRPHCPGGHGTVMILTIAEETVSPSKTAFTFDASSAAMD